MSDLYRIRWDAAATIGAPLIVEDKQHGKLGVLVPATDERLTRAEWEATIDYKAATQSVKDAWLIDDNATVKLMSLVKTFVDAAVKGEKDV